MPLSLPPLPAPPRRARTPEPSHRALACCSGGATVLLLSACAGLGAGGAGGHGGEAVGAPARLTAAQPAALSGDCAALAARLGDAPGGLPGLKVTGVQAVAAGPVKTGPNTLSVAVPAHCQVQGRLHERVSPVDGKPYAIAFELRLPLNWNGRFYHQVNGGIDGVVVPALGGLGGGPLAPALAQGFAVLSSDAGHPIAYGPFFGLDPQARRDYGYQAVGSLTPVAKGLIERAYGKAPDRSYIGGCSNGGRHTLVAAERYADQYDGYLAGAPGYRLPRAAVANIFGAQQYAKVATDPKDLGSAFNPAERTALARAVLARCDALDGATDGLVQDVAACQQAFDLQRDLPTCAGEGAADRTGQCLTRGQKAAVAAIFRGAVTSRGEAIYAPFPWDAGLGAPGVAFWEFNASLHLDSGAVGAIFQVPPVQPAGFNGPAFSLNTPVDTLVAGIQARNTTYPEDSLSFMTPPDLGGLEKIRARGGKVMLYHGVSDAIFSWHDTVAWQQAADQRTGGRSAQFTRLYAVPGMGHCSGGPSTDQFDLLSALVAWVEQGQAPGAVPAQARGPGNPGGANADLPPDWAASRSRPLCPHPQVARYRGTGSLEEAGSFTCR
ncbi:tannase/feruloyl esterase family alpha/beta hydrolase [Ideonella livida]|uniref:Tannase/feruloyl esterase family alpha/beta hydrolase n=1 Tax=Ideonella livida TaxID=2707176 RepID=A0A7C9PI01_9BURK|nr:tannase/feruloyl esterase family alpha/beta hydrolase [Ideonella livida]NDY92477.1 tannase/feruloyl esterase family alpha/beta hydrolase [Ideonella livida]